jgi:hypothetical protein
MSIDVNKKLKAVQYTGSNGAAIAAELGMSVTSDDNETLVIEGLSSTVGQWWVWGYDIVDGEPTVTFEGVPFDDTDYHAKYSSVIDQLVTATGSMAITASALGSAGRNFDVTLSTTMPDANYVPVVSLRCTPNLIGQHSVIDVSVLDEDTVRVRVASGVGSLAGTDIHVVCYALS